MVRKYLVGMLTIVALLIAQITVLADTATNSSVKVTTEVATPVKLNHVAAESEQLKQPYALSNSGKVTWNFQGADIHSVIQTVSELTGKNFIIDPRVEGKITVVSAKPIDKKEIYQVFLSILQVLGYAAVPNGQAIKIVPIDSAKTLGVPLANAATPGKGASLVARIVPVDNVSAIQLVPVLRPLMQESSILSAYTPSNSLILAGAAENIQHLVNIIHQLDIKNASKVQIVPLKHANADDVVKVLQSLQQSDREMGRVSNISYAVDDQTNSILVSGNAINRLHAAALIHGLDSKKSADSGSIRVVKLNYLTSKNIAPILQKIASAMVSSSSAMKQSSQAAKIKGDIAIESLDNSNALIIRAPGDVWRSLSAVIRKLDVRPQEVLVQAIIAQVDQSTLRKLGVQWGYQGGSSDSGMNMTNSSGSFMQGQWLGDHAMGLLPNVNLTAVVNALASDSSNDILSTPTIAVLNNEKATVSDGQDISITNRQYATSETGSGDDENGVPFSTQEYKNVAISLMVTPQIAPNNSVKLKITHKDNEVLQQSQNSGNPTLSDSKIDTTVMVNSGNILVLGGLIKHNQVETHERVPILGYIPIIGNLFHYKDKEINKKNLMVFIRPIILNHHNDLRRETMARYNAIRNSQINQAAGLNTRDASAPLLPALPMGNNSNTQTHGSGGGGKIRLPAPF